MSTKLLEQFGAMASAEMLQVSRKGRSIVLHQCLSEHSRN